MLQSEGTPELLTTRCKLTDLKIEISICVRRQIVITLGNFSFISPKFARENLMLFHNLFSHSDVIIICNAMGKLP